MPTVVMMARRRREPSGAEVPCAVAADCDEWSAGVFPIATPSEVTIVRRRRPCGYGPPCAGRRGTASRPRRPPDRCGRVGRHGTGNAQQSCVPPSRTAKAVPTPRRVSLLNSRSRIEGRIDPTDTHPVNGSYRTTMPDRHRPWPRARDRTLAMTAAERPMGRSLPWRDRRRRWLTIADATADNQVNLAVDLARNARFPLPKVSVYASTMPACHFRAVNHAATSVS